MRSDREYEEDHVEAGRDDVPAFRWIEAGHLRIEEDCDGAIGTIQNPRKPNECGLSPGELRGLANHLAGWFSGPALDKIRQIETCATYVQIELRSRDNHHASLVRALDSLLTKCRELREDGLLADGTDYLRMPRGEE